MQLRHSLNPQLQTTQQLQRPIYPDNLSVVYPGSKSGRPGLITADGSRTSANALGYEPPMRS